MKQSQIVSQGYQIPLGLDFRSTKVKWTIASLRVLGWRHELMANDKGVSLEDLVGGLHSHSVVLSMDADLYNSLVAPVYPEDPLVVVEPDQLPPRFSALCKPPKSVKDSLPAKVKEQEFPALLGWTEEGQRPRRIANPAQMRDEFFAMDESLQELAQFANKWGLWDETKLWNFSNDDGVGVEFPVIPCIFPHRVHAQRIEYRNARLSAPSKWLRSERARIPTIQRDEKPYFFAEIYNCSKAIEYLITLDHLRDAQMAVCALSDCKNIFEVVSRHGQVYCSHECAHLAYMRRIRKNGSKNKGRKTDRSR